MKKKLRKTAGKKNLRKTAAGTSSLNRVKTAFQKQRLSGKDAKKRRRSLALTITQLMKRSDLVKSNKHLTIPQAKEKRELLLRLRERITGQIDFLATDNITRSEKDNEVSYRSEEQGGDNFDRDFALNRVSLDQDILFEIDEALNRLVLGAYGICDGCGRGIEKARLKAVPYSRMCVACQSKNEGGRRKFGTFESANFLYNTDKTAGESGAEEE